jgi:tetratricopeptide (TPR) repeat protein
VLYDYGHALWRTGERARARSALLECERRAVATGTRALVSRARVLRAHHAVQAAEIGLAEFERITREELEAVRAEEEPVAVADVLQARGLALRDLGRADDAAACHEEGLRISLEIGDRWREGFARNLFGFAEMLGTTPVATAVAHCERHLEALEWGPPGPVGLWMALAVLETQAGRRDEGRERLETAARELRAVGAASTLSTVEFFAAWTAAMAGEAARARNHARTAVELLDSLADLGSRASYTLLLARLEAEAGQLDEAERLVASAHATPHQDDVFARVWSARALAAIATAKGDDPRAQELLREAVEATRTTDWLTVTAETLEQAGALEEALGAFEEKGDDLGAARVRQRLRQASE